MGRALRVIDPAWIYHAGSRGSNRGPIAWNRADYESIAGGIARAAERYAWDVFAWCVMPNHYHLVLRTPHGGFSAGFREINGNHSRRTNRRYERSPHLFENRPWDKALRSQAHLVSSIVYTLRNPLDAGLCSRASAWPYSSYRASVGLDPTPPWLAIDELLPLFGHTPNGARRGLAELVINGQALVSDTM
jgi:REP element-mobilizing transposase RayT